MSSTSASNSLGARLLPLLLLLVFALAAACSSSSSVSDDGGGGGDTTSPSETSAPDEGVDRSVAPDAGPPVEGWAKAFGSSGHEQGTAVAVDDLGNIYITGHFTLQLDLGDGVKTSAGSDDVFVSSFTPGGDLRWTVQLGGPGTDYGNAIAVRDDMVFVTGQFRDAVDFGDGPVNAAGDSDVFVSSFAADSGEMRWSRQFGGTTNDYGRGIAVGGDGNVIVGGQYQKTMTVGDNTLETNGRLDAFVASYTADGELRWAKGYGGEDDDNVWAAAADDDGNAYITGYFFGSSSFGGSSLKNHGGADLFVASYGAADGAHRWSVSGGGVQNDRGIGLAVAKDKLYVSGRFIAPGDFGGGAIPANGSFDILLASFSATDGSFNWAKGFGGAGDDFGEAIAVDPAGNIYLAGGSNGDANFGDGAKPSTGLGDIVAASFDGDGEVRWSKRYGSAKEDDAKGIAVSPQGNVCLTGFIEGPADFAPDDYGEMKDLFLIQIKP